MSKFKAPQYEHSNFLKVRVGTFNTKQERERLTRQLKNKLRNIRY